jgi:hypothetical protein
MRLTHNDFGRDHLIMGQTRAMLGAPGTREVLEEWANDYGGIFTRPGPFGSSDLCVTDPTAIAHILSHSQVRGLSSETSFNSPAIRIYGISAHRQSCSWRNMCALGSEFPLRIRLIIHGRLAEVYLVPMARTTSVRGERSLLASRVSRFGSTRARSVTAPPRYIGSSSS